VPGVAAYRITVRPVADPALLPRRLAQRPVHLREEYPTVLAADPEIGVLTMASTWFRGRLHHQDHRP
jgi:hypothetical protein